MPISFKDSHLQDLNQTRSQDTITMESSPSKEPEPSTSMLISQQGRRFQNKRRNKQISTNKSLDNTQANALTDIGQQLRLISEQFRSNKETITANKRDIELIRQHPSRKFNANNPFRWLTRIWLATNTINLCSNLILLPVASLTSSNQFLSYTTTVSDCFIRLN